MHSGNGRVAKVLERDPWDVVGSLDVDSWQYIVHAGIKQVLPLRSGTGEPDADGPKHRIRPKVAWMLGSIKALLCRSVVALALLIM